MDLVYEPTNDREEFVHPTVYCQSIVYSPHITTVTTIPLLLPSTVE